MASAEVYDAIGRSYPTTRRTDPRIAAAIWGALGDARTVLNVGAGTSSHEPPDRDVVAVEPSAVMAAQRSVDAALVVRASAEQLPSPTEASTPRWLCSATITGAIVSGGSASCAGSRAVA
jgi:hypothetical protein